ncbi:MAG: helix-turn-helix domain-containing protein [bacterium]|nr:helix-turn-helix domain-containing protein [bacterium]
MRMLATIEGTDEMRRRSDHAEPGESLPRPTRPYAARCKPVPLSPTLLLLLQKVSRTREQQVRKIVARCRRLYPHYRALSGAALEGLRENVRYAVAGFYGRVFVDGRPATAAELEPTLRMARLRVAQGVPLDAMIGCYQVGLTALWDDLIESARSEPTVWLDLLRRVSISLASQTRLITAVTEAYVAERERLLHSRGQALDEFMRLLPAEDAPLGVVEARARLLELRLESPRVAAFFAPARSAAVDGVGITTETLRSLLARDRSADDLVVGRIQEGILALLPLRADHTPPLDDVAGFLRKHGWRAGIGGPATGAEGLRRSAREAQRALELGSLLGTENPVCRYADLLLLDLVDIGSPRATAFMQRVLGRLATAEAGDTHRTTLRAVCRHGFHLKLAAAALGIHPNTMSYRLGQIRQRFGLDLEDPETRVRLHVALQILEATPAHDDARARTRRRRIRPRSVVSRPQIRRRALPRESH